MIGDRRAVVPLSVMEVSVAAHVAQMRVLSSMKSGHRHRQEDDRSSNMLWDNNWLGAMAECAFAKHIGAYWDFSVRNFSADDVQGFQVRATRRQRDAVLRVHARDSDDVVCVLGQLQWDGRRPLIVFLGWYNTTDAKQRFPLERRREIQAHHVPQEALHPMGDLPRGRRGTALKDAYLPDDIA